jgi:hypothetical protein
MAAKHLRTILTAAVFCGSPQFRQGLKTLALLIGAPHFSQNVMDSFATFADLEVAIKVSDEAISGHTVAVDCGQCHRAGDLRTRICASFWHGRWVRTRLSNAGLPEAMGRSSLVATHLIKNRTASSQIN